MDQIQSKKIIILGAGGHGRVIADIALALGYDSIAFLDDATPADNFPYTYLGKIPEADRFVDEHTEFVVGIGSNIVRRRFQEVLTEKNYLLATLVHPSAVIGSNVVLAPGTVVMPGGIVNNGAHLGRGVIVNTSASVDHDCLIGDFCHISPGAHLCGTVELGENSMIGAGSTVINNLKIPSNTIIGAGSVVVRSLDESGIYFGVPARLH